jgi:molecular chaperone DnaK (HSP70)
MGANVFLDFRDDAIGPDEFDIALLKACLDDYEKKGIDTAKIKEMLERVKGGSDEVPVR